MTTDFAVPLITGLFLGGIITEVRWVLRLRQAQIDLNRSAEPEKVTAHLSAEDQGPPPEAQISLSLRSLHDHLKAEAGTTPAIEPAKA